MLCAYPLVATNENWLHDFLKELIEDIHVQLDHGRVVEETQANWRSLVSGIIRDENCSPIQRATGIRNRVFKYSSLVSDLNVNQRQQIIDIFEQQNNIPGVLSNTAPINSLEDDFLNIHDAVKDLFTFCYEKLDDFGVRARQYSLIFNSLDSKFCPFCGIERIMDPEETAQDQDHYLAKSIYPFSGVNMRNLVPMCRVCNRDYKKGKNIIKDSHNARRPAFDPYTCNPVSVDMNNSSIDSDIGRPIPSWNISFEPECDEAETWDDVFGIRKRYKRDVLDKYYSNWLGGFFTKCAKDRQRGAYSEPMSDDDICEILERYTEDKKDTPGIGLAFLEPSVFEFLLIKYKGGESRVVQLIKDAVLGVQVDDLT